MKLAKNNICLKPGLTLSRRAVLVIFILLAFMPAGTVFHLLCGHSVNMSTILAQKFSFFLSLKMFFEIASILPPCSNIFMVDGDTVDGRPPEVTTPGALRKATTSASFGSYSSSPLLHGNVFQNVWKVLQSCSRDPYPDVAEAATIVIRHITNRFLPQAKISTAKIDAGSNHSSPTLSALVGGGEILATSPKSDQSSRPFTARQSSVDSLKKGLGEPTALTQVYSQKYVRNRRLFDPGPTEEEEAEEDQTVKMEPLVTSNFVKWCGKTFAMPIMRLKEDEDPSSARHFQREWKYMRNHTVRISYANDIQNAGTW